MVDVLKKCRKILNKYNQGHLLDFYDDLSDSQREILLHQILSIDFDEIINLYRNSNKDYVCDFEISPLPHIEKNLLSDDEVSYFSSIGEREFKKGNLAVVTMAGGQGTRLGYSGPKGTYVIAFSSGKKSLFEVICDDLKRFFDKYGLFLDWYIMTSPQNDLATKKFFEENSYFHYPKDKITFFTQSTLPLVDVNGKLMLQEPYLIKEASNGNGNVFNSMAFHGILSKMERDNIKWVSFGGIDNVLLKNYDALFLGLLIDSGYEIASKSIFKNDPLEKTAVYCRKNGKPAILDYDDINLELSEKRDDNGNFLYREANILSHLMTFDAVKQVSLISLPYHRAFKKNSFVNYEGVKEVPEKPNSFKYENFIFDAFSHFDDMLLLRVNPNEEFAPIKDFTGIYNPDTAREMYDAYWK